MMRSLQYSQTNLQLYRQVVDLAYDDPSLVRVRTAYDLAMRLHAASFRPSHRTFLSHLVGTASILASMSASPGLVISGLLHAAYEYGDFGDGTRGMTASKREALRRVVGDEVESRVAAYTRMRWSLDAVGEMQARFDRLSELERDALRVRLANELEDHLDLGILYCAGVERRIEYLERGSQGMLQLARRLGHPDLAEALARATEECTSSQVPEVLRAPLDYIFELVPDSYRPRAAVLLRRRWAKLLSQRHRVAHFARRLLRRAGRFR